MVLPPATSRACQARSPLAWRGRLSRATRSAAAPGGGLVLLQAAPRRQRVGLGVAVADERLPPVLPGG